MPVSFMFLVLVFRLSYTAILHTVMEEGNSHFK